MQQCNLVNSDSEILTELISPILKRRKLIEEEIQKQKSSLFYEKIKSYILIYGIFKKNDLIIELESKIKDLEEKLNLEVLDITNSIPENAKKDWEKLKESFLSLKKCELIFDNTASNYHDNSDKSGASEIVNLEKTIIDIRKNIIPSIKSDSEYLYFKNINGSDIYIGNRFSFIMDKKSNFKILDTYEIVNSNEDFNFINKQRVPSDCEIIRYTWYKVNKNGTPDKRFNGNYQIPVCKYGKLKLHLENFDETWIFSNSNKVENFNDNFNLFRLSLGKCLLELREESEKTK